MPKGVYIRTPNHCAIISKSKTGSIPWNKGLDCSAYNFSPPHFTGEKSSHWIDGRSLKPNYKKDIYNEWRKKNPHRIHLIKKKRAFLKRRAGVLTVKILQYIYESNIKEFGTLTCVYCFSSVQFKDDTIDHVLPLNRGGTHSKENLVIACHSCNAFKRDKLYEEVI